MTMVQQLQTSNALLTTSEVMKLLKVRRNTLCEWVRLGRIPAFATGSGYRFDPRTLAVWLERRAVTAAHTL